MTIVQPDDKPPRADARSVGVTFDGSIEHHPAAQAWAALGHSEHFTRATQLKKMKKTAAYRLWFVTGRSIVAKYQRLHVVRRERSIYRSLLPAIQLRAPGYLGSLEMSASGMGWTFLEDAGEGRCDIADPAHRRMAVRWLAQLHARSGSHVQHTSDLTIRGAADYRDELVAAQARIAEWPEAGIDDVIVRRIRAALSSLAQSLSDWDHVARAWDAQPVSVSHGDFNTKNIRVQSSGGVSKLLVFDWDVASVSNPAVDLCWMAAFPDAVEHYSYLVSSVWPDMDVPAVRRAIVLGTALRAINSVNWKTWYQEDWQPVCEWTDDLARSVEALKDG